MAKKKDKKKEAKNPFWLAVFAVLLLFILLALIDKNRILAVITTVALIMSFALYKSEKGGKK